MSTNAETPTYNVKVAVRETGLKPDTLRAWEKRYGLPRPRRTGGGHRLYSRRDIAILKWLVARQGEGLSISRAVKLWRQLEADGQNPLLAHDAPSTVAAPAFAVETGNLAELREQWLAACMAFDEARAEQILSQAFALHSPEVVCVEVLQRGLSEIGERWYRGQAGVQQEHFAFALAARRLGSLIAAAPPPVRPASILVGCPPNEDHTFAVLLITLLLRRRGWPVIYLGANVPLVRLEETLQAVKPKLVLLAAQQLTTAASLLELAPLLERRDIPLVYGGRIFNHVPALTGRITGHFLGTDLTQAIHTIERVIEASPPLPPVEPVSEKYVFALEHFRRHQSSIEAHLWQTIGVIKLNIAYPDFQRANRELARGIIAALALGDMAWLDDSMAWLNGLLGNYQAPAGQLSKYLGLYYLSAKTHLDDRGAPVLDWLKRAAS